MQNGRTHVGEFAQFLIGNHFDRTGIVNDARVRHEEAGHVGPVLVDRRFCRACDDRAGNVGAAAGEGFYGAVRHRAVKSRNDGVRMFFQCFCENLVCKFSVKCAVIREADYLGGVDEIIAQKICENDTVQVFTAAGGIVAARVVADRSLYLLVLLGEIEREAEPFDDQLVSFDNACENFLQFFAVACNLVAFIQNIGYLVVFLEALARCGGDNVTAGRLGGNDILHHSEVLGVSQRTAAEFDNFHGIIRDGCDILSVHSYILLSKLVTVPLYYIIWNCASFVNGTIR